MTSAKVPSATSALFASRCVKSVTIPRRNTPTRMQRERLFERHEHEEQHAEPDHDVARGDEREEERREEGEGRGEAGVRGSSLRGRV